MAVRLPLSPNYPQGESRKGHLHSQSEPLLLEPTDAFLSLWPCHPPVRGRETGGAAAGDVANPGRPLGCPENMFQEDGILPPGPQWAHINRV